MSDVPRDFWLDTAARIGARIVSSALWTDQSCTWHVWVPQPIPPLRQGYFEVASAAVYQGTAGIALFLTELYRHTGERRFLETAAGALRYSLGLCRALPPTRFGFHGGRVGIAYATYRFALVSERSESLHDAEGILAPLVANAGRDDGIDVIGGAAGAIPALLAMADRLPQELTSDLAIALGDNLLRRARRGRIGWSWHGNVSAAVQDLTGFAHGTAGFGYGLLELYQVTRDPWFRYAAEQAFAYERNCFDSESRNWPDFRNVGLSEQLIYDQGRTLRAQMRAGQPAPQYARTCMTAWCHGAAGIGLARLRAYQLLDDESYAQEATTAIETTLSSVRREPDNYSLCHGHFGNCETLVMGARILNRPELRAAAEQRALLGCRRFELARETWPCGALGGVADPSLLLGEAGIGYFYLRLYDETTPSVLCLIPSPASSIKVRPQRNLNALRRASVSEHFGTTIGALERLQPSRPDILAEADGMPGESDVVRAYEAICARIKAEPTAERRALLFDAFAVEKTRFVANDAIGDFTEEFLENLVRLSTDEVPWSTAVLRLANHVTLVRTTRDWGRVINQEDLVTESDQETTTVVFRSDGRLLSHSLSTFAALVLGSVASPRTWLEVTERVAEQAEGPPVNELAPAVLQQLKAAYSAGLVCCLDVSPRDDGGRILAFAGRKK